MILDQSTFKDLGGNGQYETIEGYDKPKPTFTEQMGAGFDKVVAQGLTISDSIYFDDELSNQLEEMQKEAPNDIKYDGIKYLSRQTLARYEKYYNEGTLDEKYQPRGLSLDTLKSYFARTKELGKLPVNGLIEKSRGQAAADYYKADEILKQGDSWLAPMVGGVGASMLDPVNIALLPMGGPVARAGGSIAMTAAKAAGIEMGVAAVAEVPIQMKTKQWSNEIGVKYDTNDMVANALMSIGGAGLIRGTGSAMWDATEEGLKALKKIDPELHNEYTLQNRSNISSNNKEHLDNIERAYNGEAPIIKEPSKVTAEIAAQPNAREFKDTPEIEVKTVDYDGELTIPEGFDAEGKEVMVSYKALDAEQNMELEKINLIRECLKP